jgi:acyl carrier protein
MSASEWSWDISLRLNRGRRRNTCCQCGHALGAVDSRRTKESRVTHDEVRDLVLAALRDANRGRAPDQQLAVTPDAQLFGGDSPLDSLGLVSLLIDIEEALEGEGFPASLSDPRAMSELQSPFRSVASLTQFIRDSLKEIP